MEQKHSDRVPGEQDMQTEAERDREAIDRDRDAGMLAKVKTIEQPGRPSSPESKNKHRDQKQATARRPRELSTNLELHAVFALVLRDSPSLARMVAIGASLVKPVPDLNVTPAYVGQLLGCAGILL